VEVWLRATKPDFDASYGNDEEYVGFDFLAYLRAGNDFTDQQCTVEAKMVGKKIGKTLSHCYASNRLVDHHGGDGETWEIHHEGHGVFSIKGRGGEGHLYLSHACGRIQYAEGCGDGERWRIYHKDGVSLIEACGGEAGCFLVCEANWVSSDCFTLETDPKKCSVEACGISIETPGGERTLSLTEEANRPQE